MIHNPIHNTEAPITGTAYAPYGGADYFACPKCSAHCGYVNVRDTHWGFCPACKIKWCYGANLFDSWKDETEDEQHARYAASGIGGYEAFEEPRLAHRFLDISRDWNKGAFQVDCGCGWSSRHKTAQQAGAAWDAHELAPGTDHADNPARYARGYAEGSAWVAGYATAQEIEEVLEWESNKRTLMIYSDHSLARFWWGNVLPSVLEPCGDINSGEPWGRGFTDAVRLAAGSRPAPLPDSGVTQPWPF